MTDQPFDRPDDRTGDRGDDPGGSPDDSGKDSRRIPVIVGVSVLVAGVLAAGAFAASQILGAGAQPETVMPSNVVAFASVDLDPGAGQKIEAIRTLRKFPELRDAIKVHEKDDLRKRIFEEAIGDGACKGKVDYDRDIHPWLGDKAGIAAVDLGQDEPAALLALKVGDEDAAAKGIDKIKDCDGAGSESAHAFKDGYLLLTDSKAHLDKMMGAAEKGTLADEDDFAKWSDEAGGDGIVNFYVGKRATDLASRMLPNDLAGGMAGGTDSIEKSFKDFKGMAGALRFADGGLELEVAAGGTQDYLGTNKLGEAITRLPEDTAVALAASVPGDFAELLLSRLEDAFGGQTESLVAQAEAQTGLSFPEDLQTLLGKAVVLALGGDAPADLAATQGPGDLPVGLKIIGDADKIRAVVAKAEERSGQKLADADIVQDASGNAYILASNAEFADELKKAGKLEDNDAFKEVIPGGGDSGFAIFIDFNSAWRDSILDLVKDQGGSDAAEKADANTGPLKAFGISGWAEDKVSHGIVKITTD